MFQNTSAVINDGCFDARQCDPYDIFIIFLFNISKKNYHAVCKIFVFWLQSENTYRNKNHLLYIKSKFKQSLLVFAF